MDTENDTRDHHDTPPGPARVKKDGVRQRPQCGVRRRLTRLSASLPVGSTARRHGNAHLQVVTAARRAARPRTPHPPHGAQARERRPPGRHRGPQGRETAYAPSPSRRAGTGTPTSRSAPRPAGLRNRVPPIPLTARRHGNADLQVGTARQRRAEGTTPTSGMAHRGAHRAAKPPAAAHPHGGLRPTSPWSREITSRRPR